jgi:crotonobetainyl-CoA:carnitine CoA-transferase CaiB-like acyl-CoA transferase
MLGTLGCLVGRSERAARKVEDYWAKGSTFPNFLYRCADGELLQVWFGGRGMYAKLIEVLGDEPSTEGYYRDQTTGALNERAQRWKAIFSTQRRDVWIERIRAVGVACEPVLAPGDALSDPHLAEIGLAVRGSDPDQRSVMVGSPISLATVDCGHAGEGPAPTNRDRDTGVLLEGLHVLDFSAFVAGPLGAQVLADMGADVVKVEPLEGETMRPAAYAMAACQRGKRSLALDLTAPEARPVVDRLIRWADVVLQNFRVGVAERLGIDEATVARINPRAIYCHATAFGPVGPRAAFPGNDALMQAVTGLERAVGGEGNDPLAPTWIPIDMAGGWTGAIGMLAGLYARARTGQGQQVATSLLGAGMLLQSGVFQCDGQPVRHPQLDSDQTGYGPGYRIYAGADLEWFALVLPDNEAWQRVRSLPEASNLPETYAPLRGGAKDGIAREAESILTHMFGTAPAAQWVARLRALGLLVEPIEAMDRNAFRQGILDDPLNRQLGRVASYETVDWGHFEQIGRLIRWETPPQREGPDMLPGIGEHTVDVLRELGFTVDEIATLLDCKVVRQGER